MAGLTACATTGEFAPKRLYVVGGRVQNASGAKTVVDWMQVFDPETRSWSIGTKMPNPRNQASVVNVDDRLYVLGGDFNGTWQLDVLEYTPANYGAMTSSSPPPASTTGSTQTITPNINPSPSTPEFHFIAILSVML